jgi:hypothetical protein
MIGISRLSIPKLTFFAAGVAAQQLGKVLSKADDKKIVETNDDEMPALYQTSSIKFLVSHGQTQMLLKSP